MKKLITCACVVLALLALQEIASAQGMRGRGFGPGGPHGWPGFSRQQPQAPQPSVVAPEPPSAPEHTEAMSGVRAEEEHGEGLRHHGVLREHIANALHRVGPLGAILILLVAVPVILALFWVVPISLGIWLARRRKLSPLWMLFGIHPFGGWITCLVLALTKGKVECASCGGYVKRNFRQCPFCHGEIKPATPAKPSA